MPKVSVIIPVYNSEKYLKECLDSLINQTLKDIEIICVNDGSKDGSQAILEEYSAKDRRIKIINQENKGAGAARNVGIDLAEGEYLSILDADDIFEYNMLEKLYLKAEKDNLDITICHSAILDNQTNETINADWIINKSYLPNKDVFNIDDIPNRIIGFCNGWAWDKLYRRDFIIKNDLKFQNLKSTNDMFFVMMSLCLAEKISVIDDVLIKHRENVSSSISHTRDKNPFCFIEAIYHLKEELEKKNLYKKVEQSFINWNVDFCFWHLNTLNGKNRELLQDKLKNEVFKKLKVYRFKQDYFYIDGLYNKIYEYKNKWYQNIFSVKNEIQGDIRRKVAMVLGLKIKIRKK